MTKYLDLDIREINKLLKIKQITPLDLVLEFFKNVQESNLNAFISLDKERAIKQAKDLENKEVDNMLFGIPIGIKDNIITKDLRTTAASHMLDDFVPVYDATVIKKLKDKHMIIVGKTNMDEFAMGSTGMTSYFGPTLNPWNNELVPGGSSSGSAVAVSGRLLPMALGTDTGGSIRQPSSFCATVGLKPTYGRVSRYGLIAFATSLDQIGPITRNVYENALLLEAIAGIDDRDLTSSNNSNMNFTSKIGKDISGLRIAIPRFYMTSSVNAEIMDKMMELVTILESKNCVVEYIDMDYLEYSVPLYQIIALGEASSNLARYDGIRYGYTENAQDLEALYRQNRTNGFGAEVKRRLMVGTYVLSGKNAKNYYEKALKVRTKFTNEFKQVFKKYDLIIGPVNTDVAYLKTTTVDVLKSFNDDILTIPVNMAGLPAISVPIGFNKQNLPIGLHIIGSYFDEVTIYQLASAIETILKLDTDPRKVK